MKDTRNFDRAPLKDIRVNDNYVGIRTPQVLIKREGGEYMKGDILDANATTELAKSIHMPDIDKINDKLEQIINKENEISDKLAIVDGDSNTEGSFRKAIADVIAAAPEDLDTLKEIADKLAGNDDLHTALNQAITEKS